MSAALPLKLGILAGGGALPGLLIEACRAQGISVFVVTFDGQAQPDLPKDIDYISYPIGQAGRILDSLKAEDIQDLVLIGVIERPTLLSLKPDLKGAAILGKLAFRAGDSGLLSSLKAVLQDEGFTVHGIQNFMTDILTPKGVLGDIQPNEKDWEDIRIGIRAALKLGQDDIGQSVVVQDRMVTGKEDRAGTNALITRASGGVLVKLCKPQQDKDLDLPTIGPDTIEAAHKAGMSGIAVHAGNSLLVTREEVIQLANKYKMFVIGIDPKDIA